MSEETEPLYRIDVYTKEFDAVVSAVEDAGGTTKLTDFGEERQDDAETEDESDDEE